jgi:hypothetical protein
MKSTDFFCLFQVQALKGKKTVSHDVSFYLSHVFSMILKTHLKFLGVEIYYNREK